MVVLNGITSPFFQNYTYKPEQDLLQDLIDECISITGQDVFYIPRMLHNFDKLYETDDQSSYSDTYMIAMYIDNFEQWQGEGDLASKIGYQIKDKVIWSVSRRVFQDEIGIPQNFTRPREGDLIYYPIAKRVFVVRYVDAFEMFFQFGTLQTWKMTTELFEYSSEIFNTGIPEIDQLQSTYSLNLRDWGLTTEDSFYLKTENGDNWVLDGFDVQTVDPIADNTEVEIEANNFLDWAEVNPFTDRFKEAP